MWIFIGDEYRGLFARWQSNFRAIWLSTSVQQYQFSIHWWEWHYFIRHDMAFSQLHRYRLQRLLQITFHGKTRQMGTRPRSWRKDWRKGNVVILVPVYAAFPIRIQINKKKQSEFFLQWMVLCPRLWKKDWHKGKGFAIQAQLTRMIYPTNNSVF